MIDGRDVRRPIVHGLMFVTVLGLSACSDGPPTRPDDVPASHTQLKGGTAWHAPGLRAPEDNCGVCHGRDLAGGANGEPSCLSCHDKNWTS